METTIYLAGMVLAYLAGVGTIPVIGWIRWRAPEPLTVARPATPGEQLHDTLHARTGTHDLDTMDVLTAGWDAGRRTAAEPTRKASPSDLPEGWRRWQPPPGEYITPGPAAAPNADTGVWAPRQQGGYTPGQTSDPYPAGEWLT